MIKQLLRLLILLIGTLAYSADIYVDQSAAAGGNGATWASAFQDIQSAVTAASAGDNILIATGVYQPQATLDITIPLNFTGGFPAGGGVQNLAVHTTSIQADFNPANLLFRIFDIDQNAATSFSGISFTIARRVIETHSSLFINQVEFTQLTGNAIYLEGPLDTCEVNNSLFSNNTDTAIRAQFNTTIQNLRISQTVFENGTNSLLTTGNSIVNLAMRSCTLRNLNLGNNSAIILDTTTALFTDFTAVNNTTTSGTLIRFADSFVTMERGIFDNNSGTSTLCLQGRDSTFNIDDSQFTNNSAIGSFGKPVMGMNDVAVTATNCLFEGNLASGSQPDIVGQFRSDTFQYTTTFDNCKFINNTSTGSITTILEIGYGAYAVVKNCLFDGNLSDRFNGFNSVNATGIELTNNVFRNHTDNSSLIYFYETTGGGYTASLEGNIFENNATNELFLTRYDNLVMSDNIVIGDNIDVRIGDIPNLSSTNDYYRGNSNGVEILDLSDVNADIDQMVVISTATTATHKLIDCGNNTALDIVNSTFSSSDVATTNVEIDYNGTLPSSLRNSIIWSGSNTITQSGLNGNTTNLTINHSLVKGENPTGTGNMDGTIAANEPIFVNPAVFDFRMQRCSPTINQGLNSYSTLAQDLLGAPRVFETNIDLGAYELQEPFDPVCIVPPVPLCTTLVVPLNGETDVDINTSINWNPISDATGYILRIGTTAGATDILDVTLGDVTNYILSSSLTASTQIFVEIIPYNGSGNAISCTSENFFTDTPPNCTTIIAPANGATAVPVTTDISWTAAPNITGYRILLGSTPGNTDILTAVVGNVTSYDIPFDLPQNTTVYVTIIPFNAIGDATACAETNFTTEILATTPSCTTIIAPVNGAMNIPIATDISWNAEPAATGYFISIGTAPGLTDVLNNFDNGNSTTYNPPADFDSDTTYYVTITPYNSAGNATGCAETSFTTELLAPPCTSILSPADNAIDVLVSSDITWNPEATATGYFISIGTAPGLTDVLNNFDNGNSTTYNPPADFNSDTTYYVTITPYNTAGNATGCNETSFTTELLPPPCTTILSPADGEIDVLVLTDITWNTEATATGYFISIGTAPGLTDVLNNFDNGNSTTYNPPADFNSDTTYYVTITPYNTAGNATGCNETSFTTELLPPPCTTILSPADGAIDVLVSTDITWNTEATATGYFISIGTAPGLTDVLNNFDNGNSTTYNPPADFNSDTTYYVTITPYNSAGNATGCNETSFTTELLPPVCTIILSPADGAIDVLVSTDITWNTEATATGYFISIGTAPGLTDVLNNFDNGNSTTYNPPADFDSDTTYYVTITPYNTAGNATGCNETSFTTEILPPPCTTIISPADGETEISIDSNINWYFAPGASGYYLSIGTSANSNDLLNNFDNGNNTVWSNTVTFPENTIIYVTLIPYNSTGEAINCDIFTFNTVDLKVIIPEYFTPNQDGFHDLWIVEDPVNDIKNVSIFDRYGKLLYQSNTAPHIWDGYFNNTPLPSSDYWYMIELNDGRTMNGHFALIR